MLAKIFISELPLRDGLPVGRYDLVHSQESYEAFGFGYAFRRGRTVDPVSGRPLARLLASQGTEYTVYASDAETVGHVCAHLRGRGNEARACEVEGSSVPADPVAESGEGDGRETYTEGDGDAFDTPVTVAELEAMTDDQLRACAASLGFTDRRWGASKIRAAVAEALGL